MTRKRLCRLTLRIEPKILPSFTRIIPLNKPTSSKQFNSVLLQNPQNLTQEVKMPLVVPGLMSKSGDDKTSKWMNDLVGKKIGDASDETVSDGR